MTDAAATGYGPSRHRIPVFDGDETNYELWEIKFMGYMRLRGLHKIIVKPAGEEQANAPSADKLAEAFAELIQCLDDNSLSLIIREAKDDGRKALQMLRDHYLGKGKPRVVSLYTDLTSIQMNNGENVTSYMIRAERTVTQLKSAGETISDSLVIAMLMKGLPAEFNTFCAVNVQKEKEMTFTEFKVALKNFEDTERSRPASEFSSSQNSDDSVMKAGQGNFTRQNVERPKHETKKWCEIHRSNSHNTADCRQRERTNSSNNPRRWCEYHKSTSHDTANCRRKAADPKHFRKNKDSAKTAVGANNELDEHSFVFNVSQSENVENVDNVCTTVENELLVDCGATTHILNDKTMFSSFNNEFVANDHFIELADGTRTKGIVSGRGQATVKLYDVQGRQHKVKLENALFIPSFKQNIFSVQAAVNKGATVSFTKTHSQLNTPDGTEFNIRKQGKLYYLHNVSNVVSKRECTHTVEEWHRLLGHCNVRDVCKLEHVVDGMKICSTSKQSKFDCETCISGKMTQFRSRDPDERAENALEFVHCDLAGPITPASREGHKYAISFVDDYSGAATVYFLKNKSDASRALEKFLADTAPYGKVKRFRCDNGTEFTSSQFTSILLKNQIKQEFSAPYSPHQNGTVERCWRSLFEMARCLLLEAKLPKNLWTYAVSMAAYIRNRCFNPRTNKTPYELMVGHRPNISNLHVFGSIVFAYVQAKNKLEARSEKGVFVGYDRSSPAYLVYFPQRCEIKKVRCCKFLDKFQENQGHSDNCYVEVEPIEKVTNIPEVTDQADQAGHQDQIAGQGENDGLQENRYPRREHKKPDYLDDYVTQVSFGPENLDYCYKLADIPRTYREAVASPDAAKWQEAMVDEITALKENQTFEYTTLPEGRKTVGGRWVYALKSGPNEENTYKARYVAKGYSQIPGEDYTETFSPTAKMTSVRMALQVAVNEGMLIHQMDVKTAYLNAPIDHEIYIDQPEGFEVQGQNGKPFVCKLKKSLYGLKQSGRNWHNLLHDYLINEGFSQSQADSCVFTKINGQSRTIIVVWVDDLVIATSGETELNELKSSMCQRFKMKDLGTLKWFLGIEFKCTNDEVEMSQKTYLEKVLVRFKMSDCTTKSTPCDVGSTGIKDGDSPELADSRLYREMVGSLIYVMTATRPDICYAVTKLSQKLNKPTQADLNMARHTLRYLKGTLDHGLRFKRVEGGLKLQGFCDSDWGSSEDRKSITGYCFQLCHDSFVSWKSRKQQTVSLSTCEAEYIALATATQEAKFLRQLFSDMTNVEVCNISVQMYVDNQGAIALAKNPVQHQRCKHVDIKYHFIRDEVKKGTISLNYVPSQENVADIFTKPLPRAKFQKLLYVK